MRLWGAGISSADLVTFIRAFSRRFPADMRRRDPDRDFRYLLSLDSLAGWLVEAPSRFESPPLAGRIYHAAGALYAGASRSPVRPTRYIDPASGQIRSVYQGGRNISAELLHQPGVRFVSDGPKHRFIFILAEPGSPQYAAYRAALPPWVNEYDWGEAGLGWIQPRLLYAGLGRLLRRLLLTKPDFFQGGNTRVLSHLR
jgi:hypothetical protein